MKVKITRNYYDKTFGRRVNAGEIVDGLDEVRVKLLTDARVATLVESKSTKTPKSKEMPDKTKTPPDKTKTPPTDTVEGEEGEENSAETQEQADVPKKTKKNKEITNGNS